MRARYLIAGGLTALTLAAAGCGDGETETASFDLETTPAETTQDTPNEAQAGAEGEGADTTKDSLEDTNEGTATNTPADEVEAAPKGAPASAEPEVEVPDGPAPKTLQTKDLRQGKGRGADSNDILFVNYVGAAKSTGKKFESSYGKEPFVFPLGGNQVIKGWDRGLVGMKAGGRRKLVIPPALGYGSEGSPPIKPNETLVFVIDLVKLQKR